MLMIRSGIHQLLWPALMSAKVLDGAVNVLTTRWVSVSPGATSVADWTASSFMIAPLENARVATLDANCACSTSRFHHDRSAQLKRLYVTDRERTAFARDCSASSAD